MTPNQFRLAASELLDQTTAINSAEIEIGQLRELLGMRGKPNLPRELWAEQMGLRVVATRSARKGKNAWVRVGDVCRVLEDEGSHLNVVVKKSAGRYRVLARTNGQAVHMSEPEPTPEPTPEPIPEPINAEDIAFARQQALYKRLDAMAKRLDTLQNFAYANSKRLRCLGRKLDAILNAWDITVPPPAPGVSEMDDIIDTFTFPEDD